MKHLVATLTVRIPLAALEREGMTLEKCEEEFAGLKASLCEEMPEGGSITLDVAVVETPKSAPLVGGSEGAL